MNKSRLLILCVLLIFLALVASRADPSSAGPQAPGSPAAQSPTYRLDWFTPLTTGGGGPVGSANFAANFSIGQTASQASTSAAYRASLGYWPGVPGTFQVLMPIILR